MSHEPLPPKDSPSLSEPLDSLPQHIAVEGPLGSGKTELAIKLSHHLDGHTLLENSEENPFIDAFFKHSSTNALGSHLYFLFERLTLQRRLQNTEDQAKITDFIIEKDHFLAEKLLSEEEFEIYKLVYQQSRLAVPTPDLVIYLQMPTLSIQQRLELHPLPQLKSINPNFLSQVIDAYCDFFHYYDDSPLLIVNASSIDFMEDPEIITALINQIAETHSGRHYFNPDFHSETAL
ncbi:MAG: deoxynucleoside kinase [Cellvibrionales bacterium]|nr:deoxynucleoside kinase [Cellvibrionales bacterium]